MISNNYHPKSIRTIPFVYKPYYTAFLMLKCQSREKAGCRIVFLPPYSPDLNPIEKFWAWLKSRLRKVLPNFTSLNDALTDCFQVA